MRSALVAGLLALALSAAAQEVPQAEPARSPFRVSFQEPVMPAAPEPAPACPGLTVSALNKSVGIVWNDGCRGRGRVECWVESVDVGYAMTLSIAVSARYRKGGRAWRAAWKREQARAGALRSIYRASRERLASALERSQAEEPRVPTKDAPARRRGKDAERLREAVRRKVLRVVDEQAVVMTTLMEEDRRQRDVAAARKLRCAPSESDPALASEPTAGLTPAFLVLP